MLQASQGCVTSKPLNRIVIVVGNAKKVAADYWSRLGIGPWQITTMEPPFLSRTRYQGQLTELRYQSARCRLDEVGLELIEPQAGASIYHDFLACHHGGLHYFRCPASSEDEARTIVQTLTEQDFPMLMDGYIGDSYYAFIDTTATLKCIWCIAQTSDDNVTPPFSTIIGDDKPSQAPVKVSAVAQVAFAIADLNEIMRNYYHLMGIGPWAIREVGPPELHDETYRGRPGNFRARVGYAMSGAVQLEMVQPVSGKSIQRDYLDDYGEGLHHLQFRVTDIDNTSARMAEAGFPNLMSGRYYDGGFVYYDTESHLNCIWEAFQPPTKSSPLGHYP